MNKVVYLKIRDLKVLHEVTGVTTASFYESKLKGK